MCRCCQNCWEDFYWNCFEEKFCYDETIANYNPDDDEEYLASKKNGSVLGRIQPADNNNVTVPSIIIDQPLRRGHSSGLFSNAKIHEEDYRRETQTNVPMLGPEILAVFANSQIFQDHQPTKLNRISTKPNLAGIHSPKREMPTTPKESDQDRLLRRLEANLGKGDTLDSPVKDDRTVTDTKDASPERRITFTISSDSSPEGSMTLSPKKFDAIAEEDTPTVHGADNEQTEKEDEVILRPRLIDRHPHLMPPSGISSTPRNKILRSAKSVPHFNVRPAASETDIFAITGSGNTISMTPEVPSISFSNLPKHYEDTPTIEKYRVSQSLYSIQTANAARAEDYSMPRYFRKSAMITASSEVLSGTGTMTTPSASSSREEVRRPEKEKSKRLQMLRGALPPLLIHSVSFRKTRDEGKQVD
ncbi:uncharacterized protein LOC101888381 isoform X2 [Musca domestica]|nr:uncharacterized protein LOC101888381 isoform X2 [Musca domestica]XP_011294645.1 uncharacterized protein LOC101888381 isoform X2 [Musca domestica]XP_019894183.1 uncharacterized protein LOC101888381 isoform X2 [Musca domestica]XP_058984371.1 uncharacterized protein LOC101888381 isoform X2 [Musca domestica]XP_058984372.1 uncharacterized protein LOC101888381 isoform X2 [Musca domestica]XP_058984373.1 uncharacterized protein LOC101888381 isoform X2 [Musca domestica]XP_058984374.1 uncharacterize